MTDPLFGAGDRRPAEPEGLPSIVGRRRRKDAVDRRPSIVVLPSPPAYDRATYLSPPTEPEDECDYTTTISSKSRFAQPPPFHEQLPRFGDEMWDNHSVELPTCPYCLERLDVSVSGVLCNSAGWLSVFGWYEVPESSTCSSCLAIVRAADEEMACELCPR